MTLKLIRTRSTDQGTFGVLFSNDGKFWAVTCELPDRGNAHDVSCIPAGTYLGLPIAHAVFGACWSISPVRGRSGILIHAGNVAGDTSRGLESDTSGCILVGRKTGTLKNQEAILDSKGALKDMVQAMGGEPFVLIVVDAYNKEG